MLETCVACLVTQQSTCQSSPCKLVLLDSEIGESFQSSCLILKLVKVELFCEIVASRLSKLSEFCLKVELFCSILTVSLVCSVGHT